MKKSTKVIAISIGSIFGFILLFSIILTIFQGDEIKKAEERREKVKAEFTDNIVKYVQKMNTFGIIENVSYDNKTVILYVEQNQGNDWYFQAPINFKEDMIKYPSMLLWKFDSLQLVILEAKFKDDSKLTCTVGRNELNEIAGYNLYDMKSFNEYYDIYFAALKYKDIVYRKKFVKIEK